jgi:hypothetical protein
LNETNIAFLEEESLPLHGGVILYVPAPLHDARIGMIIAPLQNVCNLVNQRVREHVRDSAAVGLKHAIVKYVNVPALEGQRVSQRPRELLIVRVHRQVHEDRLVLRGFTAAIKIAPFYRDTDRREKPGGHGLGLLDGSRLMTTLLHANRHSGFGRCHVAGQPVLGRDCQCYGHDRRVGSMRFHEPPASAGLSATSRENGSVTRLAPAENAPSFPLVFAVNMSE